ncbi:phosphorylase family protein [Clostridium saccharoperbutylacetonicum]
MINIIIIDDNSDKIKKIRTVINEFTEIKDANIETTLDLANARRLLSEKQFDLMILDICLPIRHGDDCKEDAGIKFLEELNTSIRLKKPFHIIGITSHKDLKERFERTFLDELWVIIQYEEQYSQWQKQLRNKIKYLLESKIALREAVLAEIKTEYDLAIITALHEPELSSVLDLEAGWTKIQYPNDSTVYYKGIFKNENKSLSVIATSSIQMGMPAAAVTSMKLINNFHPKYIAMVGITAGIREKANFGDILVAEYSWDYGSGKIKFDKKVGTTVFVPDPKPIQLKYELREKFAHHKANRSFLSEIKEKCKIKKPNTDLNVFIGPVASGAAVVENQNLIDDIQGHVRKLVGIEMEAYGVFCAAEFCSDPKPMVFSIKSICDFGDSKKNDDYQEYAAYTSAQYLYHFSLKEL